MITCPICANKKNNIIFSWQTTDKINHCLMECKHCGLAYRQPMPDAVEIEEIYEEDYFMNYEKYFKNFRSKQFTHYLDLFDKISQKKGKVLDVGCAFGFFLNIARQKGWEITGFDISMYAQKKAKELFGIDIIKASSIEEIKFTKESFDLITMWDVLEHIPESKRFIRSAQPLLKKNGLLLIKVPNAQELFMKIVRLIYFFSKYSFLTIGPKFEHHLYLYSSKSLRILLETNGFRVVKIIMDNENLVIDDRQTIDSFIKMIAKRCIKFIEKIFFPFRSSIVVIAKKIH